MVPLVPNHLYISSIDEVFMSFPVDPMKARYWPEVFGEAGSITTTLSGAEITTYSNFDDYIVQIVTLATNPETVDHSAIRVNSDSGTNLVNSVSDARYYMDRYEELKVTGEETLGLFGYYPPGGAGSKILRYRYGIRVTKPTVYEKLLLGIDLTDIEEGLNAKFSIAKGILAGTLSGQPVQQFTKIYEVAKMFTSTAGDNPTIGPEIHPLPGQKAVLLGIAIEEHATESEVFINVTRDNEQVMRMDAYGFLNAVDATYNAQLNYGIPLYVVANDNLRVWIENTVNITDFKARFVYGLSPLTVIEKIRWGLTLSDKESAIAIEYDLADSVLAGVA